MKISKATVSLLFDDRRIKKDGTSPVKISVYYNGDKKRYDTGISLNKEDWQKLNSEKLRDESLKLNKRKLALAVSQAEGILEAMGEFDFEQFEFKFFKNEVKSKSLLLENSFDNYINYLEEQGRVGNASAYRTSKNSLLEFRPNLKLKDITPKFLEDYEKHMRQKQASASTIGIYLRALRSILNIAIKENLINRDSYPFTGYKIPSSRNIKKALSFDELKALFEFRPTSFKHQKALDFWILLYLCNGINMADLLQLKFSAWDGDFISYVRVKTINTKKKDLRPIKVYLNPRAIELINKWRMEDRNREQYIFEVLKPGLTAKRIKSRTKTFIKFVNENMKEIAAELKIAKPVRTYEARHTHATVLKRKGVSTEVIKENLGHSSVLMTENYLDSFEDDVKKEYANLLTQL